MRTSLVSRVCGTLGLRAARLPLAIGITTILVLSGGMVYAAIPNTNDGVIHGCYLKHTGILRVIDVEAGKSCTRFETPISWNQTGPQGEQGAQGVQGEPGAAGTDGKEGAPGAAGQDGLDGSTVLNGSGPPGVLGKVGDFYLDTDTSTFYGPRTAEGWGAGVSLVGPAGPKGDTGTAGAAGPAGATGATGPAGAPGSLSSLDGLACTPSGAASANGQLQLSIGADNGVTFTCVSDGGAGGGGAECAGTAPTYPNANTQCASGTWTYACFGTWADVNYLASDGCEIDTSTDEEHCGSFLVDITNLPNVETATCVSSLPVLVCDPGWEDVLVDGKPSDSSGTPRSDGCESAIRADGLTVHDAGTGVTYAYASPRGVPRSETTYTAGMADAAATATMDAAIASNPTVPWSIGRIEECSGGAVLLSATNFVEAGWVLWVYSGPSAGELFTHEFGYTSIAGIGCTTTHFIGGEWN